MAMDGKRAAEELAGGDAKRLNVVAPVAEFKVRTIFRGKGGVGAIIGKGGVNIRSIRDSTGCRVKITDKQQNMDERVVAVTGEVAGCCAALNSIVAFVGEDEKQQVIKNGGNPDEGMEMTITLLVASTECGSIIGKAGVTIKALQAGGAKVKVETDHLPNSNERPVHVSGAPAVVSPAIQAIIMKLHENSLSHTSAPVQEYVPGMGFGGHGGGMGGGMQGGMQGMQGGGYNPYMQGMQGMGGMMPGMGMGGMGGMGMPMGGMGGMGGQGPPMGHQGAPGGGQGPPQGAPMGGMQAHMGGGGGAPPGVGGPQGGMGMGPPGGQGGMGMGGPPQGGGWGGGAQQAPPHVMTVANEVVGNIIGKGGSSIREIRAMSGAKVQISQSTQEAPQAERTVTISGAPEAINVAIYLVNQAVALGPQR